MAGILLFVRQQDRFVSRQVAEERGLLHIGRHSYGPLIIDSYPGSEKGITIGSFCSISRGVVFITGGIHPMHWVSTFPFRAQFGMPGAYEDGTPSSKGDIVVGSDVWIGTEAMIHSGVTIGDGAVVAARSVVTRDVPPYAIVAGVPAKIVRFRFDDSVIRSLLRIRWWEWDDESVLEAVPYLSSDDMTAFLERYGGMGGGANPLSRSPNRDDGARS